jgi:hypothetical protein
MAMGMAVSRLALARLGLSAAATATALTIGLASARAAEWADALALEPPHWEFDNYEIRLGGTAAGALFTSSASGGPAVPSGYDTTGGSAIATGNIRVQKTLDTGMVLGARGDFLLYHDDLSRDAYDNDTVQRVYLFAQTGFGRVEIGQQDGAAFTLGLAGPILDERVSLENRRLSLFRDPTTGADFGGFFHQVTSVQSSFNYAKINYVSPRLLGIQVGASFTPNTVRSPLPWTGNPNDDPDQQHAIWEVAASYTGYFSNIAVGLSAGFAHGRLKNRTPGFENLYDWALGAQLAYTISDVKLSVGGAYRGTNSYLLDVQQVRKDASTRMVHLSAMAEKGSWLLGLEFSNADVNGPVDHKITGYQAAAGYRINANMQITAGWQWYNYRRGSGIFYNGRPGIDMSAGFLSLGYEL